MRLPLLLLLLIPQSLARQKQRDFRTLDDSLLASIAAADPQPWKDVESGHLGRLLVPRVAGTENK